MKCFSMLLTVALVLAVSTVAVAQGVTKYVRYEYNGTVSYGILEGETIYQLRGNIFESPSRTGNAVQMSDVRLLTPTATEKGGGCRV